MNAPLTNSSPEHASAVGAMMSPRSVLALQAVRIGLVLTFATTSILGVIGATGVWPDPAPVVARERAAMVEALAIAASQSAARGDTNAVSALAEELPRKGSGILSAAVRRSDGAVLYESEAHRTNWAGAPELGSDASHARVPVFIGDVPWGVIELSLTERGSMQILGARVPLILPALLLAGLIAFVAYSVAAYLALVRVHTHGTVRSRVQTVFDALSEAVVLLDHHGTIVLANQSFWSLVKRPRGSLLGHSPSLLKWGAASDGVLEPDAREGVRGPVAHPWSQTLFDGRARPHQRMVLVDDDGSRRYLSVATASVTSPGSTHSGVLVTLEDITIMEEQAAEHAALLARLARSGEELRAKNQELEVLATIDPLTMCLNRRALFDHLHRLWSHANRHSEPLSCIMVDVDHFKAVNDGHGHVVGDAVIAGLSRRLQEVVRPGDVVGRYGGEEFCVIAPETGGEGAVALAERIRAAVQAIPCGGLRVTVSVGCATKAAMDNGPEALLARADSALYAAKRAGRNCVRDDGTPPMSKAA